MAFGPSSSGKTFTLHGKMGVQRGIIPRAIQDVLGIVRAHQDTSINQSSLEDYGSLNNPLLSVNNRKHQSREQVFTKIL